MNLENMDLNPTILKIIQKKSKKKTMNPKESVVDENSIKITNKNRNKKKFEGLNPFQIDDTTITLFQTLKCIHSNSECCFGDVIDGVGTVLAFYQSSRSWFVYIKDAFSKIKSIRFSSIQEVPRIHHEPLPEDADALFDYFINAPSSKQTNNVENAKTKTTNTTSTTRNTRSSTKKRKETKRKPSSPPPLSPAKPVPKRKRKQTFSLQEEEKKEDAPVSKKQRRSTTEQPLAKPLSIQPIHSCNHENIQQQQHNVPTVVMFPSTPSAMQPLIQSPPMFFQSTPPASLSICPQFSIQPSFFSTPSFSYSNPMFSVAQSTPVTSYSNLIPQQQFIVMGGAQPSAYSNFSLPPTQNPCGHRQST